MWGAGKVLIIIIGIIVTLLISGQRDNATKIDLNAVRIAKHEIDMESSMHRLETYMTIMSVNQKRHMEEDGVKYLDPAPITEEYTYREGE